MAAFYDDTEKNVRATDCIILSVSEGKGAAHGKKCTAKISYKIRGEEITEYVNFWNGSGAKKLDLCDRMHKCAYGDIILLLFHPSKEEDGRVINGECIDFAREGYPLWVSGMTAIIGTADMKEKTTPKGYVCAFELPLSDAQTHYKYCFWGSLKSHGITRNDKVVCMGNDPDTQITADGLPIKSFNGFKVYLADDMPKSYMEEMMITIGVFRNHPIPLSKLLDVGEADLPGRLSWCHYVADEWQPNNQPELLAQKEAIRRLMEK